jgi:hypothetical protein
VRRRRSSVDPDLVDLVVEDVGVLQARVRTAFEGIADLDLVPAAPAGFLDGCTATLVAAGGDRVDGTLEVGWTPGHVRFTRNGVAQRRLFTRVEVEREVLLVPDRLQAMWRATTHDLSAGGALLGNVSQLPLGARLELHLGLGADEELRARVRVIRTPGDALRVILFENLTEEQRTRLVRFVAEEHVRRLNGS